MKPQTKCKKCGEIFDSTQNRCPNCMMLSKGNTKAKKIILLIVGWLLISWVLNIVASLHSVMGIAVSAIYIPLFIGMVVSVVLVARKKTP